jgi:Arc/MetJ-type ribon-helix-helix transcriptional regulator
MNSASAEPANTGTPRSQAEPEPEGLDQHRLAVAAAIAALRGQLLEGQDHLARLAGSHDLGKASEVWSEYLDDYRKAHPEVGTALRPGGRARKVSVSMPEDLTAAVQRRVGRGAFSQYVTEAVTMQMELDLLRELSELLTAEHGEVPEEFLAEARQAWPDLR